MSAMMNLPTPCPVALLPDLRVSVAPDARPLTIHEAVTLGLELIQAATIHRLLVPPRSRRKASTPSRTRKPRASVAATPAA